MSVFKRGKKYWIDIRYNRHRYRYASPDNSCAGAKAYEALLRQRIVRGEPVMPKKEEAVAIVPLFQEFSKKWIDIYVKTNNKYSEIANKESVLRAHLNPFFKEKALDKISNLDVEAYKAKKMAAGLANKTINNHLIVLSKCLKTAQDWEIITKIPKIKLLKVQPQKFDFLTTEECQLLLNNCQGLLHEMVLMGLKTGLRFGEIAALSWDDIDFNSRIMTVQKSIVRGQIGGTKSNKIRYIPLVEDVLEMLRSKQRKTGFIFNKSKQPLGQIMCLNWLHKACREAEMRKIGWHTLRHTFASHLAENGVSILLIKELLGHSDVKTTMRYSHLTPLATRAAIETLAAGHKMVTTPKMLNEKVVLYA